MSASPTEIFAERLAVQTRQHDATDPRLIACHFTAGWLAAVDALNAKGLAQDLAPAARQPDADGWFGHNPGDPMPCAGDLLVDVTLADGEVWVYKSADLFNQGACWWTGACSCECRITKWRPACTQPQA